MLKYGNVCVCVRACVRACVRGQISDCHLFISSCVFSPVTVQSNAFLRLSQETVHCVISDQQQSEYLLHASD